ncbi:unnamed protein product [Oppiella nova]|uniref:non-specific serine/threonine protein kinase n=1 Tax=Oppiella nova TaxID=334625 RepID=A0A7R9LVV2_9ACAR|nr:unnamed protein product [Oppiella nova]CAG2167408.1 unnamed protein product [Oppiella nova]
MGHNILFVTFDDLVYALGTNSEGQLGFGRNIWGQLGRDVNAQGYHKPNYKQNLDFLKTFKNICIIGEGAFGKVYKVENKYDNDVYAIKECNLQEREKLNVLNETQSLIKLRSKFVIQYYYSWIESNCLYFQMELCLDNLKNVLKIMKSLFNELTVNFDYYISYEIFHELTKCVQYLHESDPQIIHRDLKPDNVLISMDGHIKLGDFGLAKEMFSGYENSMEADVGTVEYMAPEAETSNYNHLIDIYSLSLIGAQIFGFDTYDIIEGKYVYREL